MQQERSADQHHDDEFLGQLVLQVFNRPLDHACAIIGCHNLDALGQAVAQAFYARLDRFDRGQGVAAPPQDHHTADGVAFAFEFAHATAHFRAKPDVGHVPQGQRGTAVVYHQRCFGDVGQFVHIAGRADHEFGLSHLDHAAASFAVCALNGIAYLCQRYVVGTQLVGVDDDLILFDHAADGGHLGHTVDGLQFVFQEPVLKGPQLCQIMAAAAVDQGVLVNPAHTRGIGAKLRCNTFGQVCGDLAQIFQHPRTRPIQIGAVFEHDIDIAVAKEGKPAHVTGPRHRQHRGGDGIGDLVLDHLRCLTGIGRAHDHLHVRQIRDRIDRR